MTARAWPPEPPCDCLIVTVWPLFAFQYLMKAALKSWYSSRVGSYETFSSVCAATAPDHGGQCGGERDTPDCLCQCPHLKQPSEGPR